MSQYRKCEQCGYPKNFTEYTVSEWICDCCTTGRGSYETYVSQPMQVEIVESADIGSRVVSGSPAPCVVSTSPFPQMVRQYVDPVIPGSRIVAASPPPQVLRQGVPAGAPIRLAPATGYPATRVDAQRVASPVVFGSLAPSPSGFVRVEDHRVSPPVVVASSRVAASPVTVRSDLQRVSPVVMSAQRVASPVRVEAQRPCGPVVTIPRSAVEMRQLVTLSSSSPIPASTSATQALQPEYNIETEKRALVNLADYAAKVNADLKTRGYEMTSTGMPSYGPLMITKPTSYTTKITFGDSFKQATPYQAMPMVGSTGPNFKSIDAPAGGVAKKVF